MSNEHLTRLMNETRSKPRLLVVVNNFPPDRGGGGAVYGDLCYSLVQRGFDVTVRCPYPFYPEWRDKSGRNGLTIWRYEDQGVHVERFGIYIPSNPNSILQRLLHDASLLLSLMRSIHRGRKFDVVMAYCPLVSGVAFSALNRMVYRKPLWLNVQDLAAEAAAATGIVRHAWISKLLRGVQRWLFNRADVWSTISPMMIERLEPMRRRNQTLLLLPNWLNASLASEIEKFKPGPQPRACHEPMRLLYAGNIGKKQNLLTLLKLLHESKAQFEFAVHGSGAQALAIERWVANAGDARFRFGPFLDEAGFARMLSWTDFFVISETGDSGASFMPSKLVPGIASGAPILAICDADGPLGIEVRRHELGPWFSWAEASQIGELLSQLGQNRERFEHWSRRATLRAAEYDRDAIIDRVAQDLRQLCSNAPVHEAVT